MTNVVVYTGVMIAHGYSHQMSIMTLAMGAQEIKKILTFLDIIVIVTLGHCKDLIAVNDCHSPLSLSSLLLDLQTSDHWKGCVWSLRLDGRLISRHLQTPGVTVTSYAVSGCHSDTVCRRDTCSPTSMCIDEWNHYSCQCLPGI